MLFGKKPGKGQESLDFVLSSADKENIKLSSYRGQTVLLVFLRSSG